MNNQRWEHFEHEADIGVRGYGGNLPEAFTQTALALSSVITDLDKIDAKECITVECNAPDYDILLLDWLNELIYQMADRKMLFSRFSVDITESHLVATICGETVNQQKHQPAVEIKGATLTQLKVIEKSSGEWIAQCIVDV